MTKTILISGKEVTFATSGAFMLRYKNQFKSDPIHVVLNMYQAFKGLNLDSEDDQVEAFKRFDTEVLFNLVWCLAKTADKKIPEPFEWLDSFDEFPIFEIMPELLELIMGSLQSAVEPLEVKKNMMAKAGM